ncbi:hypothetical protein FHX81_6861 [Saccharothrix saharensis]|uniref:Subtilisin inhibitor-like n=1 Tax=Saccharothrix saharensis TaxID=571190 RepID=A0A543JNI8_9PSEU|nr:hypothetical protein [Saccharothrix saharensis]TQM84417.1 hypothetical protein FHX81_6861 [Saccharothrix saharensis]
MHTSVPPLVSAAAVLALITGCSTTVSGASSGTGAATTTTTTTSAGRESTPEPTSEPSPLPTIDEAVPAQYCEDAFPGALGKPMLAVVVETPSGRLTCDQAAAVLVDYYAERRDPTPGLPPLAVGTMRCNQVVPEGSLPQVVCADEDNLVYSMWPQT